MRIHQAFQTQKPLVSFEIFPPKRDGDIASIYNTIDELASLTPDYISVTYGAAGTERSNGTLEISKHIQNNYNINALAHMTCAGASVAEIDEMLNVFKAEGIENVLALRGDFQPGVKPHYASPFHYASDLIGHIKSRHDFSVGAACYPEGHIESKSRTVDLLNLQNKVKTGADFLITQLFFDNELFYSFAHEVRSLDIDIPITVGVMPVLNRRQIERMVELSGAKLPDKFRKVLSKYEHNPSALQDAGIAYACEQIVDLISSGVEGIHLYVMNKPDVAKRLVGNISGILKDLRR